VGDDAQQAAFLLAKNCFTIAVLCDGAWSYNKNQSLGWYKAGMSPPFSLRAVP
jgi:hypothetical protein